VGASKFVGRVGGLAVALGVGVAVFSSGHGWPGRMAVHPRMRAQSQPSASGGGTATSHATRTKVSAQGGSNAGLAPSATASKARVPASTTATSHAL